MTLTEFLLARINEDETLAQDAICPCGGPACTIELGWYHQDELTERMTDDDEPGRTVPHILHWSPNRVMAECDVKRRIVDIHQGAGGYSNLTAASCLMCGWVGEYDEDWPCETIKALALPYADHPDYQQEWKVAE